MRRQIAFALVLTVMPLCASAQRGGSRGGGGFRAAPAARGGFASAPAFRYSGPGFGAPAQSFRSGVPYRAPYRRPVDSDRFRRIGPYGHTWFGGALWGYPDPFYDSPYYDDDGYASAVAPEPAPAYNDAPPAYAPGPPPYAPGYDVSQAPARASIQTLPSKPEDLGPPETYTLIFKDGRAPEQIQNYIATPSKILVLNGYLHHDIPIAELDLPATMAANQKAGVDFRLPISAAQQ